MNNQPLYYTNDDYIYPMPFQYWHRWKHYLFDIRAVRQHLGLQKTNDQLDPLEPDQETFQERIRALERVRGFHDSLEEILFTIETMTIDKVFVQRDIPRSSRNVIERPAKRNDPFIVRRVVYREQKVHCFHFRGQRFDYLTELPIYPAIPPGLMIETASTGEMIDWRLTKLAV